MINQPANNKRVPRSLALTCGIIGLTLGAGVGLPLGLGLAPEPEPVVETVTETEYVEVEVEVAPEECLALVTSADDAVTILLDALEMSGEAMGAASVMDVAGVEMATERLTELNQEVGPIAAQYKNDSLACELKGMN